MHYTQLFRQLREARELSIDALASRAKCHRNTVINVEKGRGVKFDTLADLMAKMGYPPGSPEVRALALLWLEDVSGIPFSRPETSAAATKEVSSYRRGAQAAARQLAESVSSANLTTEQIRLLAYAAHQPGVLAILESICELVESSAEETPQLKVAEDK
ncbi:MAG: hypothetical protein A3G75_10645 [Verrucomicrobia bacterium RIFCSPLOWO2_12_FULL_64_8]|nr:MAG: hypothetical protein A3G75_10645 [Verrucomicrobia bacterium RIFCSPLOWO2_12_FULL_64_8]